MCNTAALLCFKSGDQSTLICYIMILMFQLDTLILEQPDKELMGFRALFFRIPSFGCQFPIGTIIAVILISVEYASAVGGAQVAKRASNKRGR